VWLAAVWGRHVHHPLVADWLPRQDAGLVVCRVAQMSLLRLLALPTILGADVVTRSEAWRVVDALLEDDRIGWVDEPPDLDPVWRAISARHDHSHELWTDDYLAAFAQTGGFGLVTLDQRLAGRYPSIDVATLGV
jgi:uncharacterized protein